MTDKTAPDSNEAYAHQEREAIVNEGEPEDFEKLVDSGIGQTGDPADDDHTVNTEFIP